MGEDEGADVAVQREAIDAVTGGQHQHGRRPVESEAGTDLLRAGLEEVFQHGVLAGIRRA